MSNIINNIKDAVSGNKSKTESGEQQFSVNPITDADQFANAPKNDQSQNWTPGLGSSGNVLQAHNANPGLANVDAAGQQPILSEEERANASASLNSDN